MTADFRGSIVALITPMSPNGQVDTRAYERLLEHHLECGTDGLVIGGTTGESPTLGAAELEELVTRAVRIVNGAIPVIAGSGTNSTSASIELTRRVCGAGADGCLVVTPYYNRPTQEGLYRHFTSVADAATVPVILYNVPVRTGCDLLAETVARLAAHPRIGAIKEATAEVGRARHIISLCGESLRVLSGDDASALKLMHAGAVGVISVTANVAAVKMKRLCDAAASGDWDRAAAIDEDLRDLHQALFLEPNPIAVKYAASRLGLCEPRLRLPMTPFAEQHHETLVRAMKRAGLEVTN